MVALVAYGAFWSFMFVGIVSRRVRLGYLAAACGVVGLAMGISAGLDWPVQDGPTQGVLVAKEVVVRKGNGEGYDLQFAEPLHEGLEFTVVEQRGGWIHMELSNGQQGWVRADQAEVF
jgi:uncharacterized protein YgiM (DUF1202 family)